MSRPWKILLIGSLLVNFLVLGAVVGMLLRGAPSSGPRQVDLSFGPFTRALTDEDRRQVGADLRQRLREDGHDRRLSRTRRAADHAALIALLQEEPFRPAAFAEQLGVERARMRAFADSAEAALVARVAAMSPAERQAFAGRLSRDYREREEHRGKRRRD